MTAPPGGSHFDALIVGGGIIGCSLARELAGRGLSVAVIERGQPGVEASSAAAGLLAPQAEGVEPGPFFDLGLESRALHARWAQELVAETGIDVGYRRCGILRCSFARDGRVTRTLGWQKRAGLAVEQPGSMFRTKAKISREIEEALFFPEDAIVDSALLTRALALSASRRGVTFLADTAATRFLIRGETCTGVETEKGALEAGRVVDAAGAWAAFDSTLGFEIPVEPLRGQIVELAPPDWELETVVQGDDVYLVPRGGGRVLAGATAERVGFRKEVTAGGMAGVLGAAIRLVPDLSGAQFVRAWAGLRPATPDGLPILGRSPVAGLFLAAGHFRSGILLAPVTALRMADLLTGGDGRGLEPFSVARFGPAPSQGANPPRTRVFG